MKRRSMILGAILNVLLVSFVKADGVLMSWSANSLEGMTAERWEVAKKRSVQEILEANRTAKTWPDAYLCLVGANERKDDKSLLTGLITQLADSTERPLSGTGGLILWERIAKREIVFEGKGLHVQDDLFSVAGRANWILRSVTKKNFGYVNAKPSAEILASVQDKWKRWLAGDDVPEYASPYPAKGEGFEELRSPVAVEALIVSLQPSPVKERKTLDCLRRLYGLDKLPTEPGAPGRLCSPDPWVYTYLTKVTEVSEDHDADWWAKWWDDNKSALVWNQDAGRFEVRRQVAEPK